MGGSRPAFGAQRIEAAGDPDLAELHAYAQALGERKPGLQQHHGRRDHAVWPGQQRRLHRGDNAELLADANWLADHVSVRQPITDHHALIVRQSDTDHHPVGHAAANADFNDDDAHAEHAHELTNAWRRQVRRSGAGGRLAGDEQARAGGQPVRDREGTAQS